MNAAILQLYFNCKEKNLKYIENFIKLFSGHEIYFNY